MLRRCRTSGGHTMINAAKVVFMPQPRTLASTTTSHPFHSPPSTNMHLFRPLCTVTTNYDPQLEKLFEEKRSLRSKIRKELKKMDPIQRSQEDDAIQRIVLEAPWFKTSRSICAYISCDALREVDTSRIVSEILSNPATDSYNSFSTEEGHVQIKKQLYLPRVEDKNSNMKMLKVSSFDDLVLSSMNILEPTLTDCNGNPREDVTQASEPVDLFILPGLAFDRSGRRLGRSGGYYDLFLMKYQELVRKQNWKEPLLVALSYSVQLLESERIAVTPYDIPVDGLVSPSGFIPINQVAFEKCHLRYYT